MKSFTYRLALLPMAIVAASMLAIPSNGQSPKSQGVELPMQISPAVYDSIPVGSLPAGKRLDVSVSIRPRDYQGLRQFADDVSNPKRPLFRQFITPKEVGERFGQTAPRVEAIVDYLRSKGLSIELVADNRFSILASGTVAQIEDTFEISMVRRQSTRKENMGELFVCYSGIPRLPKSIAPYVIDVSGLDGSIKPNPQTTLTPAMTRTLYNSAPIYNAAFRGQGRNIGISNWDGYRLTNVPLFYSFASLPTPPGGVGNNIIRVPIAGRNGNTAPLVGEGDLDIQMVLGMAPLSKLRIYDNAPGIGDPVDLVAVLTRESNDNLCEIITESYGWSLPGATAIAAHNVHLAMTTQGITYMCASGDSGTETLTVSPFVYPTFDGEVLMVGGTEATTDASGVRTDEVGWSGSGGSWTTYAATFNTRPAYQVGTGVPTDIDFRLSPDVAFHAASADFAYFFYVNGMQVRGSGTSASAPMFAGSLGLVLQQVIANEALPASGRLGRLQDVIYALNGDANIFHDITVGFNGILPNGDPSFAGVGWDFVTGWGAIDFDELRSALAPIFISSTSVTPGPIVGGGLVTPNFYVTLLSRAPSGGVVVNLTSSDPSIASVPATMTIPASGLTSRVVVTHHSVAVPTTVTLSARVGTDVHTSELTLTPPTPTSVTITPTKVVGGAVAVGKLTINVAAPTGGLVVPLLSSAPSIASVPATITVPAGLKTVNLPVTAHPVTTNQTATIQATYAGVTVTSKPVTVVPPTFLSAAFNPPDVIGGSTSTVEISATLNGPAPAGGVTVGIGTPTQPSVISVPVSVFIPEGATTGSVGVTHHSVTVGTSVAVPLTYLGVVRKATIRVFPFPGVSSVTLTPNVVIGGSGTVVNGVVKITMKAPPEGVVVSLSSNDVAATVPTSVTVTSGMDTASFVVNHSMVFAKRTATITATRGSTGRTGTLTIKP